MRQVNQWSRVVAGLGLAWGMAAMATPAIAAYQLITEIPVPSTSLNPYLGGPFTAYDISFFDDSTQLDYVADRTNGTVDVFSAKTNALVGQVGGPGVFQGIQPPQNVPNPPAINNALSGPDGVVVTNTAGQHDLWAGDGNSTLKGFHLGAAVPPVPAAPFVSTSTGGKFRVDEGAFDPAHNVLLFANNADTPPFGTLFDAKTGNILGKITFDGTNGAPNAAGVEQAVWDKNTQRFYINIDTATGPGGIAAIDPTANGGKGAVTHFFDFADAAFLGPTGACGPTGLAVGPGSQLTVACGAGSKQSLVFDPTANGGTGKVVATFTQVTGGDEVWYDPTTNRSFITGLNSSGSRILSVIDFSGAVPTDIQDIPTSVGAHSVAVDPVSGEIFVPAGGGTPNAGSVCPNGCILVFAQAAAVPEPASLTLMMTGLAGLAGLAWRRRRRS